MTHQALSPATSGLSAQVRRAACIVVAFGVILCILAAEGQRRVLAAQSAQAQALALNTAMQEALRGIGEVLITEGSKSSRQVTEASLLAINELITEAARAQPQLEDAAKAWPGQAVLFRKILDRKTPSISDDETVLAFGKLIGEVELIRQAISVASDTANHQEHSISTTVVWGIGAGILLLTSMTAIAGVVMLRKLRDQLGGDPHEAIHFLSYIAAGDLTHAISTANEQSLMGRMEQMRQQLHQTITGLSKRANQLSDQATDLAMASTQLASSADQSSQSAMSMAGTVEEMAQSVTSISETAAQTSRTIIEAGDSAQQSSIVVLGLAQGMSKISDHVHTSAESVSDLGKQSENIHSIVAVIQEIAEQTNLLALNAAIEAARAGETGRGFAVVADEVRKLAERTSTATRDISQRIEAIRQNVQQVVLSMNEGTSAVGQGRQLAQQAAEAMQNIQNSTKRVIEMVAFISQGTSESRSAAVSVADGIESIAQYGDKNSRAANKLASTAEQLHGLADDVRSMVGQFRVVDARG